MTKIPAWAEKLTIDAGDYLKEKDYEFNHTVLYTWRKGKAINTSGTCFKSHIAITQGENRTDAKLVLLHELAHWVTYGEHHSEKFWLTAWDLYRHFKIPIRHCLKRERNYRKGAMIAYHKSK